MLSGALGGRLPATRYVAVGLVDVDLGRGLGPDAVGHADVVDVGVGEEDGLDVAQRPADARQSRLQQIPLRADAGVDERQAASLLDEVAVDDELVHALDTGGHLHRPMVAATLPLMTEAPMAEVPARAGHPTHGGAEHVRRASGASSCSLGAGRRPALLERRSPSSTASASTPVDTGTWSRR